MKMIATIAKFYLDKHGTRGYISSLAVEPKLCAFLDFLSCVLAWDITCS